jgi:hypothetical protein
VFLSLVLSPWFLGWQGFLKYGTTGHKKESLSPVRLGKIRRIIIAAKRRKRLDAPSNQLPLCAFLRLSIFHGKSRTDRTPLLRHALIWLYRHPCCVILRHHERVNRQRAGKPPVRLKPQFNEVGVGHPGSDFRVGHGFGQWLAVFVQLLAEIKIL